MSPLQFRINQINRQWLIYNVRVKLITDNSVTKIEEFIQYNSLLTEAYDQWQFLVDQLIVDWEDFKDESVGLLEVIESFLNVYVIKKPIKVYMNCAKYYECPQNMAGPIRNALTISDAMDELVKMFPVNENYKLPEWL